MNGLSNCRVLLVDDVKENINVLVNALKGEYKLGFALNGPSALEFVRKHSPDLILLDLMMPGMDGYEVCRRLKADPGTRDIPVLFITAMDEVEHKTAAFEAGGVDYITKPFEILEVKARVKTHLSLRRAHAALARQRDQLKHSLDLASEVQQSLLPQSNPEIKGLDIAGTSIYCDETGGDYYDYLDLSDRGPDRIGVVVGDVSEHGIPSALLMTTVRAFLRQRYSSPGDLGHILSDVNWQLARDVGESGQFMTMFCSEIDYHDMSIHWVSAGHDPAFVYDSRTGKFDELAGRGLPLGVWDRFTYRESVRDLREGQIIVIGTDGIWEAHSPSGDMFGKERLRNIIREHGRKTAREIVQAVIDNVKSFRYPLESEDDITLVVIKVKE